MLASEADPEEKVEMLLHVVAALCSGLAQAPDGANRICPLLDTSRLPDVRSLHARTNHHKVAIEA